MSQHGVAIMLKAEMLYRFRSSGYENDHGSSGPCGCLDSNHVEQSVRETLTSGSDGWGRAVLRRLLRHEGRGTIAGGASDLGRGFPGRAQRCRSMTGELGKKALSGGGADSAGKHIAAREAPLEHVLPKLGTAGTIVSLQQAR